MKRLEEITLNKFIANLRAVFKNCTYEELTPIVTVPETKSYEVYTIRKVTESHNWNGPSVTVAFLEFEQNPKLHLEHLIFTKKIIYIKTRKTRWCISPGKNYRSYLKYLSKENEKKISRLEGMIAQKDNEIAKQANQISSLTNYNAQRSIIYS